MSRGVVFAHDVASRPADRNPRSSPPGGNRLKLRLARQLVFSSCALLLFAARAGATTFTNWTSIDVVANTAQGVLGTALVTMSGSDISFGNTDGTSGLFNFSHFCPPLAQTDHLEFIGHPSTYTYTVSFSQPVLDPVLHLRLSPRPWSSAASR